MTVATPRQIAAIALVTAAGLLGVDRWRSTPENTTAVTATRALEVTFSHLSPESSARVEEAFLRMSAPGLGPLRFRGSRVEVALEDSADIDIVALVEALRLSGFSAASIALRGHSDVALDAELPLGCCAQGDAHPRELFEGYVARARNLSRGERFGWFDSAQLQNDGEQPVMHIVARAGSQPIDVLDALRAIEAAGLAPRSMKLSVAVGRR